jgi:hypothetical protein
MFWKKTEREARRQRVLDELMDLDTEGRRRRLETAVAVGDVRRAEVDQVLTLVGRLDGLRVMTIPASGDGPDGETHIVPIASDGTTPLRARVRRRTRKRGWARQASAQSGSDGQSADKAVALRRAGRAAGPRRHRDRSGAGTGAATRHVEAVAVTPASDTASLEQRPDISWLRP